MSVSDLQEARGRLGMPPDGPNGRSLADRAGDDLDVPEGHEDEAPGADDEEQEDDEELFVLDQGRRVSLGKLIPRGVPIEYRVRFEGKSMKGGNDMGLLAYNDPDIILVMSAREGKVVPEPTYDEDGRITKVTLVAHFKPRIIHDATSFEGRALLGLPLD